MKVISAFVGLAVLLGMVSATEIVISSTAAGLAAFLLASKVAAIKGFAIGRALRGRRSTIDQEMAEVFLEASHKDQYDCLKSLICELHAKNPQELEVS